MMEDRICAQRMKVSDRQNLTLSQVIKDNTSLHRSVSVSRVRKVSSLRRHRSHQSQLQHFPVKSVTSNSIIHASIHSSKNSIRSIDSTLKVRSIKKNESSINKVQPVDVKKIDQHPKSIEQFSKNILRTVNSEANTQQIYGSRKPISTEKTSPNHQSFSIASTNLHRSDNHANTEEKISSWYQRNSTDQFDNMHTKRKRNNLNGYCCRCTPVRAFIIAIAILLLAAVIIALLVTLIKPTTVTSLVTNTVTTSTTSTTTTLGPLLPITHAGDLIFGLYNTTAGGSTGGFSGRFSTVSEEPPMAIDGLLTTKYLNYGNNGSNGLTIVQPGINTGFYVTPNISTASIACALLFATGNDALNRDPLTVTLEGTNSLALNSSSSWTLIYNGPTGIDPLIAPNRSTYCTMQNFSNAIPYQSYRLLITSQRGNDDSVQYGESQIRGYY